jgi:hypothetical protein
MRKLTPLLVGFLALPLSGCLGDVMEIFCDVGPDPDHCYQAAAVQEGDPADCEKVAGEGFSGSNPPRDKCHLQIAENTGDPSVCDNIEGGFMSYSKEECLENVWKNGTVDDCKDAKDPVACRTAWAKHGDGCGTGFHMDKTTQLCKAGDPPDDDIENKVEADLKTMGDAMGGKYMDALTKAIEDEDDPFKKEGLEKYKEFLENGKDKLDQVATTVEQLEELKRIFVDAYHPSMDIENMPVDKILAKGFFDKVKDGLFGADEPTGQEKESADAEDAIAVYEAMLKRQEEIDFLKKDLKGRLGDVVVSKAKDEATGKLKETAEGIAEGVAGTAFATVGIVDKALSSFQEEAKKQEFIGLARAYNRRREALEQQNPGLSPADLHARTVQQVKEDPYQDNTNTGFIKHGNLLENPTCSDGGSELCIEPSAWWVAMDKTYQHQHKKKR